MEPDELDYKFYKSNVLILIIMEDTHGVLYLLCYSNHIDVLILIIMEDTHGARSRNERKWHLSLNPYYNGRYSWR